MISQVKIKEHLNIYKRFGIPVRFEKQIRFLMNAIDLPLPPLQEKFDREGLTILYVGRSTPEKRVHLIAEIASIICPASPDIHFKFLGEVKEAIPERFKEFCTFLGNQNDAQVIDEVYTSSDILILLSDTEGFPMVVMEAMAIGLAIIATAVGELPLHIQNRQNGFIIDDYFNEKHVVATAVDSIRLLYKDKQLLKKISEFNLTYAYQHFGMDRFTEEYRQLFNEISEAGNS